MAAVIDQTISQAVEAIEEGLSDSPELLAKVSQRVLAPLREATAGAKTWFISPDGELNRLPFAALTADGGGDYLSEVVDLRLLTTGRELLDLQKTAKNVASDVVVVADPAYGLKTDRIKIASRSHSEADVSVRRSADLSDQLQWDRLKGTAKEGKAIQGLIGGELLMREEATAEAIKRRATPQVLHLATHAFYLPNQTKPNPPASTSALGDQRRSRGAVLTASLQGEIPLLRSGVAMAGANQPTANPTDDGYLTALEVAQLDWDGTELVVISACESGRGDIQSGEGVYGLKRAIAVAGARSSLLSLWKVDDAATAAFMQSFYERLKAGEGRADALAETQQEFREHQIPGWRHPYVWAAFQLSGDWKPIEGL